MRSQWIILLLAGSALTALFAQASPQPIGLYTAAISPAPATPLSQISAANVSQLALAWTYKPSAPPPCSAGTCLPLLDCERVYKRAPGTANLDKLNNNLSRGNSHGY